MPTVGKVVVCRVLCQCYKVGMLAENAQFVVYVVDETVNVTTEMVIAAKVNKIEHVAAFEDADASVHG